MRIVLLGDEASTIRHLRPLFRQHPDVDLVAQLTSVEGGVAWFSKHAAPDLILADIQLADGLSSEIFDAVAVRSPVIFTSSYTACALQVFEWRSTACLPKPAEAAHPKRAVDSHECRQLPAGRPQLVAAAHYQGQRLPVAPPLSPPRYRQRFLVNTGEQLLPVAVSEVAYFFTTREVVYLVRQDGRRFGIDYKLDYLEKVLDPARFFRVNRQYLVPFNSIDKLYPHSGSKLKLELTSPTPNEVLVSRERTPAFKRWLEEETTPN